MECILNKSLKPWLMIVIPAAIILLCSCENKNETVPRLNLLTLPSQSVKEFETIYSDSGKIELIMRSPLMEQFDNSGDPYYQFPEGIHVDIFDGQDDPSGSVTSKYAKYTKSANLWELRDSVVVINEKNDMLETEVLYWDQGKDLIYSDRFVRFTNEDQIVMGTGFESDSHLRKRKIRKVSATIYLNK